MKRNVVLIGLLMSLISACGGSSQGTPDGQSGDPSVNSAKKYLASNIVFSDPGQSSLKVKNTETVDTTTKILAENVILDTAALGIQSGNVQNAFEEVVPNINQVIIGTWSLSTFNIDPEGNFPMTGGKITFYEDKSVSTSEIDSANSALGFLFLNDPTARNEVKTYQIVEDVVIVMGVKGERCDPNADNKDPQTCVFQNYQNKNFFPILKLSPNKIVTDRFVLNRN